MGLCGLPAFTAEQIHPCLVRTFERRGLPEAMLIDYAAVWWGTMNGYGLTWLSTRLIEHGIRLMSGRVRHPQTQGKVVRFHRTLDEAIRHRGRPKHIAEAPGALDESRLVYAGLRPHEAPGMQAPRQRYRVSAPRYQGQVQEWAYPERGEVRRLIPA